MIDFNELIDNYLKRESRSKQIGRYYPSEIGMCLRKIWYSYKFPAEVGPELLKIFEMGNILHDFVVDVFKSEKNAGIELVKSEFPFKKEIDDFIISGRIDNLIEIKSNGKNVLVEVKSSGDIGFVKEASPHNAMQLQLYMHMTGIHDGILLYVDKKNLLSKVFRVEYNEEEGKKIIDRFKALHKFLTKDYMPEPEARAEQHTLWMCRFCEYRDKCYAENPTSGKWL